MLSHLEIVPRISFFTRRSYFVYAICTSERFLKVLGKDIMILLRLGVANWSQLN
jgi:hypothetical protein